MKYNKLVRDKVTDIIEMKGERAVFHIASDVEYHEKLREKLREEVEEFLSDESISELADILEVLEAFVEYKEFKPEDVAGEKGKKAEKRGAFTKRIILDES